MTSDAVLFDRLAQAACVAGRADVAGELLRVLPARPPADAPADAPRLHAEAVAHLQAGRPAESLPLLQRAVRARPDVPAWHDHLGVAFASTGKLAEAEATFRLAAALDPANPSPARNLMQSCLDQKKWPAALAAVDAVERLEPTPDLTLTRAVVLSELARYAEAEELLTGLMASGPPSAALWNRLGVVRGLSGRADEAVECFREQLKLTPADAGAHANLAAALGKAGRWAEAVAAAREAVRLDPAAPGGWANLGNALRDLGRLDEATDALRRATDLDPAAAEPPGNLGLTLAMAGRLDEALPWYDEAVRRRPDGAEARFNRAVARLALGDYERGWPEYEWRWQTEQMRGQVGTVLRTPRRPPEPADVAGKTVLVETEQGHGDTIQFLMLVPRLVERGATVLVLTVPPLARLVATAPGVSGVFTPADPPPPHDLAVPLMSLPLLLGLRVETIPAAASYLQADPAAAERWRDAWRGLPRPLVGVAWQGNPKHVGDRWRSVKLAQLAPVAAAVAELGGTLVSLQVGPGTEQLADAAFGVADFRDRLPPPADFADTAAAVAALDRVVAVDSAVAHLAGALGVPVAILVPVNADWRWLRGRADTPWYPSARLLRQQGFGDWPPAVAEAARWLLDDPAPGGAHSEA